MRIRRWRAGHRDLAHQRHHHHGEHEARRDGEVGVREGLDLCFPVCEQPQLLERRGLTVN